MKCIVILGFCLVVVNGMPFEFAEDEEGLKYYMVPLSRERREAPKIDWNPKPEEPRLRVNGDAGHGPSGTDFRGTAEYDFYRNRDLTVGAGGSYGRHYGGPGGTGPPSSGGHAYIRYRF
ncbi:unnamed protein product [Acanthoscelides obtectus]|uniref:Uncharacterized protein n=1 Tax=Acanthoscelides obtectus TaxID=200917 RepID=A0A9P0LTS7_ACAOB|nr:unnamed protein product [Acanthoscelides obtectus]CAK1621974.1 hypothetical protein AOBTE_LOCUS1246 [Acanthoscelides obtectus]